MNALQTLRESYAAGEARAIYELVLRLRFGLSRTDILLGKDTTLSANDKAELQIIVDRVAKGEPVQYVLGIEEFCGRTFLVGPGVLIPRPETGQLVHLAEQNVPSGSRVLDVGTGSGCIAVSLALAGYKVTALDISEETLSYARRNAERLGAEVEFVKQDILSPDFKGQGAGGKEQGAGGKGQGASFPYDAIVSNPPYVCRNEAAEMEENVRAYEPHLALFVPDDDPLLFYRAIADYGLVHLSAGGWLLFETNRAYALQVAEMLRQKGYTEAATKKDQFGNDRFVVCRKGASGEAQTECRNRRHVE